MLEWVTETQSYTVTELSAVTTSDSELDERIRAFLAEHPASSTRRVWENVTEQNQRISIASR
jgi:hypothetical protein